jgi:hypothetical protein
VVELRFETEHTITFSSTSIMGNPTRYMDCVIKEVIEITLHPRNFKKASGFTLSWSSYPVTNMLKQYRDTPTQMPRCKAKQSKHMTPLTSTSLTRAEIQTWTLSRCIYGMVWVHSYITALMTGTEMFPETLVIVN